MVRASRNDDPPVPPEERIRAAIDIGSNSVHLLVARLEGDVLTPLLDTSSQLGLGEAVDRHGRIPTALRVQVVATVAGYVDEAARLGAADVTLLGTEPLRRASDRALVLADVQAATGLGVHVLSHEAEAELTLLGVLAGHVPEAPTLVLDIGGGSSEAILVSRGTPPRLVVLPTGSARLSAGFVGHDPPTEAEIADLRREAALLVAEFPARGTGRAIVVGGSGANLLRLVGGVDESGAGAGRIDQATIERAYELLMARSASELAPATGLTQRRVRQMAAGIALVEAGLLRCGLPALEVSSASLREGAIVAVARCGEAWPERLRELVTS